MRLREESLEILKALVGLLFQINCESEPGFIFRFSLGRWLFISILLPGGNLRANVLSSKSRQNLIHFKLVLIPEFLSCFLPFFFLRGASLAEHVDLELVRALFLINDLKEELRVVAIELSVVRLVIDLFSRLPWLLLSTVEIASLSIVVITIAVVISLVVIEATLRFIIIVSLFIIIVSVVRTSFVSLRPVVSLPVVIASVSSALTPVIVIIISTFSVVPGLVRVSFALFCLLRFLVGVLLHLRTSRFWSLSKLEIVIILIVVFDLVPSYVGDSRYVFLLFSHFPTY